MIILFLLILIIYINWKHKEKFNNIHYIKIKQVFKTYNEKKKGLMYKKQIGYNEGYLFLYTKPQHVSFWMKNTFIPLDIILLNSRKKVIGLLRNMIPMSNKKKGINTKIKYAIEINQGYIDISGIKIGDFIDFKYI